MENGKEFVGQCSVPSVVIGLPRSGRERQSLPRLKTCPGSRVHARLGAFASAAATSRIAC